ncbi:MAG: hypothetical protein HY791_21840 [Deltaproteobacteria bacterium]|nr:hypothetical protein [Deltaproteobacteria bacterium]
MRAALLLMLSACGEARPVDCGEPPVAPLPMTEARARELGYSDGPALAVSASMILGDCRPAIEEPDPDSCSRADLACSHESIAALIQVLPTSQSLRHAEECNTSFRVDELRTATVAFTRASSDGGAWLALLPDWYVVVLSADGRCAACGGPGESCLMLLEHDRLTVRDLVLDLAEH